MGTGSSSWERGRTRYCWRIRNQLSHACRRAVEFRWRIRTRLSQVCRSAEEFRLPGSQALRHAEFFRTPAIVRAQSAIRMRQQYHPRPLRAARGGRGGGQGGPDPPFRGAGGCGEQERSDAGGRARSPGRTVALAENGTTLFYVR